MDKKIYLIDTRATLYVDALIPTLPDKTFAEEAERQGNAYTLDGFLDEYNEGNINSKFTYVRYI
jgi:hypothetical protein